MGKVIAILNQKGGVGKTTTALELAGCLTYAGCKTLLIDLDSQRNATFTMGAEDYQNDIYTLLTDKVKVAPADVIVHSQYHGDLIPGAREMSNIECGFEQVNPLRLKQIVDSVKDDYTVVILDSHPGLGSVTIASLLATDEIIVPILPDQYSIQGLVDLNETLTKARTKLNATFADMNVLLVKYKYRTNLHREVRAMVEKNIRKIGGHLLDTNIRDSIKVSEAQANQLPLYKYAPKEGITADYVRLTEELVKKLEV